MANQKIKKSEMTLAGITMSILLVMAISFGMFLWINDNAMESGRLLEPMYEESYNQLQGELGKLNNTIESIKQSATEIVEPDSTFSIAWNGIKGLLKLFQVPLELVSIGWQSYQLVVTPLAGIIPMWIINMVAIGIIAFIIYVIVSIFKGDPNVIR